MNTIPSAERKRAVERFPRVGVGALVFDAERQRVLLQLRRKDPEKDHWSMPGGRVEFQETLANAIRRELNEELGVDVAVGHMICVTDHIVDDSHWVSPAFAVYLTDDQECAVRNASPDESEAVRWFLLSDVPDKLTITTRNALRNYNNGVCVP